MRLKTILNSLVFSTLVFAWFSFVLTPVITHAGESRPVTLNKTARRLQWDQIQTFVFKHNFFYAGKNDSGDFFNRLEQSDKGLILDKSTGLMWQQNGSEAYMTHRAALEYVQGLNSRNYLGYSDWRLPALEELFSLLDNNKHKALYISPLFDQKQMFCWSANISINKYYWGIMFNAGIAYNFQENFYVRAVRTHED